MPTTTNYGWTTPADTDLVKDGAAAIRTLGTSVDTTTKALNPSTTLGDIEYRSSTANTNTRLGIGTSGQVLTVSGGVPAWATVSAGGMTLLSTTTMSGSSVTISSISQSYKNLQVLIYGMNNGNNATFACTPNGTSSITNQAASTFGSINGAGSDGSNSNNIRLSIASNIKASTPANAFQFTIFDYSSTTGRKLIEGQNFFTDTGQDWTENYGGVIKTTSAITSLVFSGSSGTYSAGTILIYGVS